MSLIKSNRAGFPSFPGLFLDFFNRELLNWDDGNFSSTSTTVPSVNVRETTDNFEVELAAPGMEKKDFKIELDGNTLKISSFKEFNRDQEQEGYRRKEFSYQSFQRNLLLPKDVVEEEGIVAKYENGLLQLTIPKKEQAKQKPAKLIEIV